MQKLGEKSRFAVIGYGSWATALVKILMENEPRIVWYVKREDVRDHIKDKGNNPRYLQGVHFSREKLLLPERLNDAVEQADIVVLAVPSAFLKEMLEPLSVSLADKFVVSAIKGIIPGDYLTVAEYMNTRYSLPFDNMGIIAGPCHSEEVALERLSYLTLVTKDPDNAAVLCGKFTTSYIHANPSVDIYGAEYAAVLKNIYAICAGMAIGLGYGDNFLSVLISNAFIEMNRFLAESYPAERDTGSSAYLGDLLVTCYSQFSRNRTFGAMIGKGYRINSAMAEMKMIAEGYYGSECIEQVNKRFGIDMPIADCVYRVLYQGYNISAEMRKMTERLL